MKRQFVNCNSYQDIIFNLKESYQAMKVKSVKEYPLTGTST